MSTEVEKKKKSKSLDLAITLEDYLKLPDSAHEARLCWGGDEGDYKPLVIAGRRQPVATS